MEREIVTLYLGNHVNEYSSALPHTLSAHDVHIHFEGTFFRKRKDCDPTDVKGC
jgi:hypothetical protein